MRRHSWQDAEIDGLTTQGQRCVHCDTERVRDESTKTLYAYRGGRAMHNHKAVRADQWVFFVAGVIPVCVER